jgi:hypothetical protein
MTTSLWAAAANGGVMQAELFPLSNVGRVRFTPNWLYTALNCDPNDSSPSVWTIAKLDATHISLSQGYAGMTLYASVRDDWNWQVELQAPFSADWITAVGGDETIGIDPQDLLTARFQGFNGQYIAVDGGITSHDDSSGNSHSGYLLHSTGSGDPKAYTFFLGIQRSLQPGLQLRLRDTLTADDVRRAYAGLGLSASEEEIGGMAKQLGLG